MDTNKRLMLLGNLFFILPTLIISAPVIAPLIRLQSSNEASTLIPPDICLGLIAVILSIPFYGLVGHAVHERKWYPYCMIASACLCLSFPFGTAFGIFSLVTLFKPEVKAEFYTQNKTEKMVEQIK
jgi:hypothetical protein